jgi:hypothetical protein
MRATVLMEDGKALEEEKLKKAFEAAKLQFVSLEVKDVAKPEAAWIIQAAGMG